MIILPTTQTARYIASSAGTFLFDGITCVGECTASPLDLVYGEGEVAFLAAAKDLQTDYNPLPDQGFIEAGKIYSYQNRLLICRQSHDRTIYDPADTPALFVVYRVDQSDVLDWIAGERVEVGYLRVYGGKTYACIIGHVAQSDWTPDLTPTLWKEQQEETIEYQAWVQPAGAHDVYNIGDRVTFNGHLWESRINANVWSPAVYGWLDLGSI